MPRKMCALAGLAALLAASPAGAQEVTVDLSPYVGLYLPTADFLDYAEDVDGVTLALESKHKAAFLFGGRVTLWFTSMFGLEGGFAYALSDADPQVSIRPTIPGLILGWAGESASVWLASLKGLFRLGGDPAAPVKFHVGGGLHVVGRSGDAYSEAALVAIYEGIMEAEQFEAEGTTDFGGVLNVGATIDVSEVIAFRIDAEDYLYSGKATFEGDLGDVFESDSKLQNDLVLTGSLVIKLGR